MKTASTHPGDEPGTQSTADRLVERYVAAVGRHLPRSERSDVQEELRLSIREAVEAAREEGGPTAARDEALRSLRELGPPRELAASYRGQQPALVGPEVFPAYRIALVVSLLAVAAMIPVAGALDVPGLGGGSALEGIVGRLVQAGLVTVGAVTVVFAALERWGSGSSAEPADWDPGELPPVDDPLAVEAHRTWLAVGLLSALFLLVNLSPEWIGFVVPGAGGESSWTLIPILGESFRSAYLPWVDAWIAVGVLSRAAALRHGRWPPVARWIDLGASLVAFVLLYLLATGVPLVSPAAIGPGRLPAWAGSLAEIAVAANLLWLLADAGRQAWRFRRADGSVPAAA